MRRLRPAVLTLAIVVAGCGGGDASTSTPAPSTPAAASSPAVAPTGATAPTRQQPQEATVVGVTRDVGDLTTLYAALLKAGAVAKLSAAGPFTVFAPTNEALASDGVDGLTKLLGSPKLDDVLLGHVVAGRVTPTDGAKLRTLAGTTLTVTGSGDDLSVGSAKLANPQPYVAGNGVVYELDGLAVEP